MNNGAASGQTVPMTAKRQAAIFLSCVLALSALALLQPGAANLSGPVFLSTGQAPSPSEAVLYGVRPDWRRVRPAGGVAWLSGTWREKRADDVPVAFRMSGLFSAELYWDGRLIGRKGTPSVSPTGEIAGPIDSAILIPERLIRSEGNAWALKVSSHHAGYETPSAIEEIDIGPYRGSGRGLDYYLPALLLFGGIVASGVLAIGRYAAGKTKDAGALTASAVLLAAALMAEISRAVVNYAYDWHVYRQSATLTLLSGHLGLLIFCLSTSVPKTSVARNLPVCAAAGAVLAFILETGFDQKMVWIVGLSYASVFVLSHARMPARAASPIGIIALCGLVFVVVNGPHFLNAGVYAVGLALLAAMLKRDSGSVDSDAAILRPPDPHGLFVSGEGEERVVPWSQVSTLRAFGNFTEVRLRSGAVLEDRRGLGRLLRMAPAGILRVHKSFAANIDCATGVTTVRRGSYRLLLADGRQIPLSRTMRGSVRDLLKSKTDRTR